MNAQTNPEQPKFIEEEKNSEDSLTLSPKEIEKAEKEKRRLEKRAKNVEDYVIDPPDYVYEDKTYDSNIKSILFHKEGFELNPPIINLGNLERLVIHFDDLSSDINSYAYTIEHCTRDWQSSGLIESEYIEGFFMQYISDYRSAFNTKTPYIHHTFTFPNNDLRIMRSGNYLLKVFQDDDPSKVIFTRRFMVVDEKVGISAQVVAPRNVAVRHEGQEINFSIFHPSYSIDNPYSDLYVAILQNQQWNTAITGLKPVFIKDRELVYDYDLPATFMGGNEFRYIDLKSFTYQLENILKIEKTDSCYYVLLRPDEKRTYKRHITTDDINGRFIIKNADGFADHTESDYALVHFSLLMENPFVKSNIYIYGGFNGYQLNSENRMIYDENVHAYKGKLLLKQGYYNYQYAVLDDESTKIDLARIEGSHRNTSNDYLILVYHRNFSDNYDQLIGQSYVYSIR